MVRSKSILKQISSTLCAHARFTSALFILLFGSQVVQATVVPPPFAEDLMVWLDASQPETLFSDKYCQEPLLFDESGPMIGCWKDLSGNGFHAQSRSWLGKPKYYPQGINSNPSLRFDAVSEDTLKLAFPEGGLSSDFTLFMVYRNLNQEVANDLDQIDSYHTYQPLFASSFHYHEDAFELVYRAEQSDYIWRNTVHTELPLDITGVEPTLLALSHHSQASNTDSSTDNGSGTAEKSLLEFYGNGTLIQSSLQPSVTSGNYFRFVVLNWGLDAGKKKGNNSIAELLLYDRPMDSCEIEAISQSLAEKYNLPFADVNLSYDALQDLIESVVSDEYGLDLAAIYNFVQDGCSDPSISLSGESDYLKVLTEQEPSEGEYLVFGHNGAEGTLTDLPMVNGELIEGIRFAQTWAFIANDIAEGADPLTEGLQVRVALEPLLSGIDGVDNGSEAEWGLVIDEDGDGDFSNANLVIADQYFEQDYLQFNDVSIPSHAYVALYMNPRDDNTNPPNTELDSDGDTLLDSVECASEPCPDTDYDGKPNYLDTDDDDDGILTIDEIGDDDGDSVPDYLEPNNLNTDSDGRFNVMDNDDDGDQVLTRDEVGDDPYRPIDADQDNIPDYLDPDDSNIANTEDGSGDSDRDGLSDRQECPSQPCQDTDGDLLPDYVDFDDETGRGGDPSSSGDDTTDNNFDGRIRTSTFQTDGGIGGVFGLWIMLTLGVLGIFRRVRG